MNCMYDAFEILKTETKKKRKQDEKQVTIYMDIYELQQYIIFDIPCERGNMT